MTCSIILERRLELGFGGALDPRRTTGGTSLFSAELGSNMESSQFQPPPPLSLRHHRLSPAKRGVLRRCRRRSACPSSRDLPRKPSVAKSSRRQNFQNIACVCGLPLLRKSPSSTGLREAGSAGGSSANSGDKILSMSKSTSRLRPKRNRRGPAGDIQSYRRRCLLARSTNACCHVQFYLLLSRKVSKSWTAYAVATLADAKYRRRRIAVLLLEEIVTPPALQLTETLRFPASLILKDPATSQRNQSKNSFDASWRDLSFARFGRLSRFRGGYYRSRRDYIRSRHRGSSLVHEPLCYFGWSKS